MSKMGGLLGKSTVVFVARHIHQLWVFESKLSFFGIPLVFRSVKKNSLKSLHPATPFPWKSEIVHRDILWISTLPCSCTSTRLEDTLCATYTKSEQININAVLRRREKSREAVIDIKDIKASLRFQSETNTLTSCQIPSVCWRLDLAARLHFQGQPF